MKRLTAVALLVLAANAFAENNQVVEDTGAIQTVALMDSVDFTNPKYHSVLLEVHTTWNGKVILDELRITPDVCDVGYGAYQISEASWKPIKLSEHTMYADVANKICFRKLMDVINNPNGRVKS